MDYFSDYVTSSEPLVRFAYWATLFAVYATLILIFYIILIRLVQQIQDFRTAPFDSLWRPLMIQCSFMVPESVPELEPKYHTLFLYLWNHYQSTMKGEPKENLNRLAEMVGLQRIARFMLYQSMKRKRLIAITTLGYLRSSEDWDALLPFLKDKNTYTSMITFRALFHIDNERATKELLPMVATRNDWPDAQVASILSEQSPIQICEQLNTLVLINIDHPSSRLLRFMDACKCRLDIKTMTAIIDHAEDDHIISSALNVFHDPRGVDLILPFINHPRWHMRVHAASALGRIGKPEHLPELLKLLRDQEWWVRYRAAQALVGLPFMNMDELDKLIAEENDRYARDILIHAKAEV